jgi:hypothetical protein
MRHRGGRPLTVAYGLSSQSGQVIGSSVIDGRLAIDLGVVKSAVGLGLDSVVELEYCLLRLSAPVERQMERVNRIQRGWFVKQVSMRVCVMI